MSARKHDRSFRIAQISLAAGAVAGALLAAPRAARAQSALERFSVHVEGGVDAFLAGEQTQRFGLGGSVAAHLGVRVAGPLSVQAGVGSWWFAARDNGDTGRMTAFQLGLRVFYPVSDGALGGPVLDAHAGLAVTGELPRFQFDVGAGWEFAPASVLTVGPVVRYVHVVQPDSEPQPDDAMILFVGLGLTLRVPPARRVEAGGEGGAEPATAAAARPAPEPDGDADGLPDARDACPTRAEDPDGFQDEDGCPEADNDGDGLADATDRCPDRAETRNGFEDDDGCPDEPPPPPPVAANEAGAAGAAGGDGGEPIGAQLLFDYGSSHLHDDARRAIAQLCHELREHPEIVRVRAVGHADERGSPAGNQLLSAMRAAVSARRLVACGIAGDRVESMGVGATDPACTEHDEECRRTNRRVVFVVVERRR